MIYSPEYIFIEIVHLTTEIGHLLLHVRMFGPICVEVVSQFADDFVDVRVIYRCIVFRIVPAPGVASCSSMARFSSWGCITSLEELSSSLLEP